MFEIAKLLWDLVVIRDATRKGQMDWRTWVIGIGFVVFLYGTALPASLLYEAHPQYKPLFLGVLVLNGIAFVWLMVWGMRRYRRQSSNSKASKVVIGSQDEVFYSGSATKPEALALGEALKETGYFMDRGVSVFLEKGQDGRVLSFVVKEGAWNQPSTVTTFENIGRSAAASIGGLPLRIRLLNKAGEVKGESTVGKVDFEGGDTIYYLGSATESEAQSLGKALQLDGFFQSRGSDVFLSKHPDGVALGFVMTDKALANPALPASFDEIVRGIASSVGGLPLRFRLLSTSLEMKKEEWVR